MNGALSRGAKLTLKLTCQRGVTLGQPTSRRAGMEKSQGQMLGAGRGGGGWLGGGSGLQSGRQTTRGREGPEISREATLAL